MSNYSSSDADTFQTELEEAINSGQIDEDEASEIWDKEIRGC